MPAAGRGQTSGVAVQELTGLTGWAASVVSALGPFGVGALVVLETVFPPIPSEVVLPLAGYLANRGEMSLALAFLASVAGSVLGAVLLYETGRRVGMQRSARMLARLPLVDREDVDRAAAWFQRHGPGAVFFGRLVPGVRSLVSLPAGADAMPRPRFVALTAAGSALWNGALLGTGWLLGTQWQTVERWTGWIDRAVLAAVALAIGALVVRRVRRHRAGRDKVSV